MDVRWLRAGECDISADFAPDNRKIEARALKFCNYPFLLVEIWVGYSFIYLFDIISWYICSSKDVLKNVTLCHSLLYLFEKLTFKMSRKQLVFDYFKSSHKLAMSYLSNDVATFQITIITFRSDDGTFLKVLRDNTSIVKSTKVGK